MSFSRTLHNISERHFIGSLLSLFNPPIRMSTIDWAAKYRILTSTETTVGVGNYDHNVTPYMEYVYDCLDNPYIPKITSQKSARIGWTEVINNYRGKTIHTNPRIMLLGFPTASSAKTFGKGKWKSFLTNVSVLHKIVDVGLAANKRSIFDYSFPNGELRLRTMGSITSVKSDNIPYIEIEEADDAKDDVAGQGDLLANLDERQKLVPITQRKLIFGGTPTNKDFSRVEKGVKASNQMIFKAECHACGDLIGMDGKGFENIKYDEYQGGYIDDIYGKNDPESAYFSCPSCNTTWTFEQKNINIINGKKHGFVDHTGNHSKGWHPLKPNIKDNFGFIFSELLSPFPASTFVNLTRTKILADIDLAKGKEGLMKSYTNNKKGMPYASGFSAMEAEDMVKLRSNYPELIAQANDLVLTIGIDVQHNRFAIVILGWGRNGNCTLILWKEIFGNVFNPVDKVWSDLTDICTTQIQHASGKLLPISAISIDSGDGGTTELVYSWVNEMNLNPDFNGNVRATKGVRDLRYSKDEIYSEPSDVDIVTYKQVRRTLAETMGVKIYKLGAHRCHDEILRRVAMNAIPNSAHDRFFFNETSYGDFEEQMTSCRKLIDTSSNYTKEVYKLVSGKRKEAIDCCKNAFHASYAIGIRDWTEARFKAIEDYLWN
jgi:phage terminase large subunit GpA-like protein